jgi:hypothetical protein
MLHNSKFDDVDADADTDDVVVLFVRRSLLRAPVPCVCPVAVALPSSSANVVPAILLILVVLAILIILIILLVLVVLVNTCGSMGPPSTHKLSPSTHLSTQTVIFRQNCVAASRILCQDDMYFHMLGSIRREKKRNTLDAGEIICQTWAKKTSRSCLRA